MGKERIALLMETICATGIRVSEVKYITAEAAERGRTEVSLKGKVRTILIPGKLCRKLQKYAKKQKIVSGILPGVPGRGKAGGRTGTQLHRDHSNLPDLHRSGTRPADGAAWADYLTQSYHKIRKSSC